jgi:hypothetical protein
MMTVMEINQQITIGAMNQPPVRKISMTVWRLEAKLSEKPAAGMGGKRLKDKSSKDASK